MKNINIKRSLLLVAFYFIASLITSYFFSDSFDITGIIIGAIVFGAFVFIAELLSKKDVKR